MKNGSLLSGRFDLKLIRDKEVILKETVKNAITNAGLNAILDIMFAGSTQITTWYGGLIDNAGYTALDNADTMGSHTGWAESVAYSDGTRPAWPEDAASGQIMTNTTSMDFNINGAATLKGIFLTSSSTKSGTTGTLWCTAPFAANIVVANLDVLQITYSVTAGRA